MSQKAEIQYVSQFCNYGSERDFRKKKKKKKPKDFDQGAAKVQKLHTISLDPVAILGIIAALVLFFALLFGGLSLHSMWREHVGLKEYMTQLKSENSNLRHQYSTSYNLDEIRTMADSIGLVPEEEAEVRYVRVTPPDREPEKGPFDDLKWFLKGLFE